MKYLASVVMIVGCMFVAMLSIDLNAECDQSAPALKLKPEEPVEVELKLIEIGKTPTYQYGGDSHQDLSAGAYNGSLVLLGFDGGRETVSFRSCACSDQIIWQILPTCCIVR